MSENNVHLETELALIRRDIGDINRALHGDGKDQKGLVATVEDLVATVNQGRWSLKMLVWIGGVVAGAITAAYHLKTAISAFYH